MAGWIQSILTIERPMSEKMAEAGLNTVISISIVFLVLIIISFIISLLKYVNLFEMKRQKMIEPGLEVSENKVAEILQPEEESLDDGEIIAVIMAAITAYEAEQGVVLRAEDLKVRSIRRVKRKSIW